MSGVFGHWRKAAIMANSNLDWLDKIIEEQKGIHTQWLGNLNLVSEVAAGIEKYGDSALDPNY